MSLFAETSRGQDSDGRANQERCSKHRQVGPVRYIGRGVGYSFKTSNHSFVRVKEKSSGVVRLATAQFGGGYE